MSPRRLLPMLPLALVLATACRTPATLVLRGGTVHTLDPRAPLASAVAVSGRRIVAVGEGDDVRPWIGPDTRLVELDGRTVTPAFADAHLHLLGLGQSLQRVDLVGTTSYEEVVARVAERAADEPPGRWILGRGWDQNDWPETRFPHHAPLSAAVPDHPVVLRRVDGHALLANAAALSAAGVSRETRAPDGGRIVLDARGRPTGVLVDNAMDLVDTAVPDDDEATRRDAILRAIDLLHARGVTSVHDAGIDEPLIELYARMAAEGELALRTYVMVRPDGYRRRHDGHDEERRARWLSPVEDVTGDGLLTKRAIKVSIDGALGSRGAALHEPYADAPGETGLLLVDPAEVEALAIEALRRGMQMCVHAIGDRGNTLVLDAFETALAAVPPEQRAAVADEGWRRTVTLGSDHGPRLALESPRGSARGDSPRFRVEHAQVLAPDDVARFAELGVIPSMQAQHLTSDMPWARDRLGEERVAGAYAWRALLDTGVVIPGGSDAPVERVDPMAAFHAAVTRRGPDRRPPGGWSPEQAMTRREALAHLTLWPAWAAFQEDRLGSIEPGKLADLVVLDGDPLALPADRLPDVRVEMTILDGEVVHERRR